MNKKAKNKGFTLVELIVVLVILAILAAITVPSLLGFIDKAKDKNLVVNAKYLLTAVQTEIVETYGKGDFEISGNGSKVNDNTNIPSIKEIIDLSEVEVFGDPGKDWVYGSRSYAIYNGFGWGQETGKKVPAQYHFKVLVDKRGTVHHMVVCYKEKMVVYNAEEGFTVEKVTNCLAHSRNGGNKLYNFLFLYNDESIKNEYMRVCFTQYP